MLRLRPTWPASLLLLRASSAFAQTAFAPSPAPAVSLDALIVTAQHREQSATEVPLSLTAYSGAFLTAHGLTRYEDLAPLVPGFFASVQSPNAPSLNLRGISTDSTDPRTETRVSVFQDGVSLSRATASVVELFDLARIEVLKGPQSTLFGRSAEAGAMSLVTRRPEPGTASALSLGAGDAGQRTASGFFNTPLGHNHLLGRVAFTAIHRDGTVANLADGSDLNSRETVAVRPSLRWLPGGRATTVDLIVNHQRDTPSGTAFKSAVIPTSRGDTDPFTAAELNRGAALGVDRTVWGVTTILAHPLTPAWTLHAIAGWRTYASHEEFDGDGSRLFLLESADDSTGRQFSQELRLNYDDRGRFAGSIGATYFREHGRQQVDVLTDERVVWPFLSGGFRDGLLGAGLPAALVNVAIPALNPFAPQPALPAGFAAFAAVPPLAGLAMLAGAPLKPLHTDTYVNSATIDALDLFADGTWRATDRLELTAGARVTAEKQIAGYAAPSSPVPSTLGFVFGAAPNFSVAPTRGQLTDTDSATGWTGRLAARWSFTSDVSTYASLSRGRRPATLVITSTDRFRVGEESLVNTELGLKGRALQHRLLWSAAVFHYRYRHFQTLVQDATNAARFLSIDAGRATGRGAEFSLQGTVAPSLQLFTTYGYTDATFDATGENGAPQRFAGSTFRLTSRHTAALGAIFLHDAGRAGRFTLSPVWQYRSAHFFDDDNTRAAGTLRQPGFALINLRLGWTSPGRSWEATAFATNLLDRKFLIDAGNIGASFGIPTFVRGEPRLLGAEFTRRF